MGESVINFRVDTDLKNAFELAAKARDLTTSQLLRHLMRGEVEDYMAFKAQGSLLDARKKEKGSKIPAKEKKPAVVGMRDLWEKKNAR